MELLAKFLQDRPQSALRQNVVADYYGMLQKLQGEEKWPDLVAAGERFLTVVPDDELTVSALAAGYQKTKDQKKFVVFGEKVFAKKPEGTTAYYLAQAYKDLKNDAKFIEWGEKTVSLLPDNHEILLELTKKFGEAKKNAQAAKYARQTIKALQSTSKPEGATDKLWKDYTTHAYATCYNVIGNVAYEQQDYGGAITNLENTLKYYSKNDLAYYHLAHSYWQKGQSRPCDEELRQDLSVEDPAVRNQPSNTWIIFTGPRTRTTHRYRARDRQSPGGTPVELTIVD